MRFNRPTWTFVLSILAVLALSAPAFAQPVTPPSPSARLEDERNTIDVFRTVSPATVFITQKRVMRDRWAARTHEVTAGSGSGFVWDKRGHIVTNYHVIADGTSFTVTLKNGKEYAAKLVGGDPNKDIAVLQIKAATSELTPIELPDKRYQLEVGQKALAIGNPFGLDHTLTVGVISALEREMKGYGGVTIQGIIQTDASINPGNSGGPLLNSSGQLIGMNTMIYSQTGSSVGIGFAVPVQIVRRVVPELIEFGKPVRAGLGIQIIADDVAQRNGIKGVVVSAVSPGSAAEAAGLQGLKSSRRGTVLGDVIVGVAGKPVSTYDDLYNALDAYRPGDTVEVEVMRDGKRKAMKLKLTSI